MHPLAVAALIVLTAVLSAGATHLTRRATLRETSDGTPEDPPNP